MTNCNDNVSGVQANGLDPSTALSGNTQDFTPATDGVVVNSAGIYKVEVTLYQKSTTRSCVGVEVTVDGIETGRRGASGYIANTQGHNESSTSTYDIVLVSNGQKIGFKMFQLAQTGTVTAPAGTMSFILTKMK